MSLDHVLGRAEEERTLKAKARDALEKGRISRAEYDFLLRKETGAAYAHDPVIARYAARKPHEEHRRDAVRKAAIAFAVLVFGFAILWALSGGPATPAGHATFEASFSESAILPLNVTDATSLAITGSLSNGSADVFLLVGADRLLVYSGEAVAPSYSVTTGKSSYALGGAVDVEVVPSDSSYTLWLEAPDGAKTLVEDGFIPAGPGEHVLDALINDTGVITKASVSFTVREDADPLLDVVREPVAPSVSFVDACEETCALAPTGDAALSLEVVLSPGAVLRLDSVSVDVPRANAPPVALSALPDVNVSAGEAVLVDLSSYFSDPDGDNLTFDFMAVPGVEMSIEGSVLRVAGVAESSQQSLVYASDLYAITASNAFTITVTPGVAVINETANETNVTEMNATTNSTDMNITETNLTAGNITEGNTTVDANLTEVIDPLNATEENATINLTLDCSNPDPNQRPLACLQGAADLYFAPQNILLEDLDRNAAARLTPIGNLLLSGEAVELSSAEAPPRAFAVRRNDGFGQTTAVAFIDETGNLHLRGRLYEEQLEMVPAPGAYTLQNGQSVTIAWFDRATGDLYIRGNVIPYRRSVTG